MGNMELVEAVLPNFYDFTSWIESVGTYSLETALGVYSTWRSTSGSDLMAEDWDNCLIIDACRFDVFRDQNSIPGELGHRRSRGSCTFEFFERNFLDSTCHDTVYVTANPVPRVEKWCQVDLDSVFYEVVDVWEDHWDEELNTVPPAPVETAIRDAHSDYPDKRILGHFIQPHQPFLGETGRQIDGRGMRAYDLATGREADTGKSVWDQLEDGELARELVWKAYRENLDIVLSHVESLCEDLTGKTVVTSDHGNLFGEFAWPFPVRKYGHPPEIYTKKLVQVPWLEIEADARREIVAEPPLESAPDSSESERLERLSALGYR